MLVTTEKQWKEQCAIKHIVDSDNITPFDKVWNLRSIFDRAMDSEAFININQWVSARLQYLQCVSNGDTAVLHQPIEMQINFLQPVEY